MNTWGEDKVVEKFRGCLGYNNFLHLVDHCLINHLKMYGVCLKRKTYKDMTVLLN